MSPDGKIVVHSNYRLNVGVADRGISLRDFEPIHIEICTAKASYTSCHDRRNLPEDFYGAF